MDTGQLDVVNIEKKKRGRPSKPREIKVQNKEIKTRNKTENINEYMKNYMKEYSKTHKHFIQCEVCNKPIQNSNKKNHFSSMEHNYNELQKKLKDMEAIKS